MIEDIWIVQDKNNTVIRAYSTEQRANEDLDILGEGYKLIVTPVYHGAPPQAIAPIGGVHKLHDNQAF